MDQKLRIAMQRVKAQEALGKLKAVGELFGVEAGSEASQHEDDWKRWSEKIAEFERWLWDESPIA